jgi:hypothetical protein
MGAAIGSGAIQGQTDITLRREGNVIKIQGEVEHSLHDVYDYALGKDGTDQRLPHGILGGKWFFTAAMFKNLRMPVGLPHSR